MDYNLWEQEYKSVRDFEGYKYNLVYICPYCNSEQKQPTKYCPDCGGKLISEDTPTNNIRK